jgi:tetratricopeptide (TPR) repeat protein
LRRFTILYLMALLAALPAHPQPRPLPQQQTQMDASVSIFTVLAAINAAGYDAEIDSVSNHPRRKMLRDFLAAQKIQSVAELKRFVRDHRRKDPGLDLSQYISYGLVINGPPDFSFRYAESALPPDVAALEGLTPLLVAFYREAHLEELWKQTQPAFDEAIAQYQEPVSRAILQANAYLRNVTSGFLGRHFQIFVDLLGAPNQVQAHSYLDDYFVVVTPAGDLPIDDIRHAYLHFLVDPLPLKFSDHVQQKRGLLDYAQGAPALEDQYKSDFTLLTTECFIKAVESRISRKPAMVDQALREGFVMTPAFAEQLVVYEKQEVAMRLYFPDLVDGIDLKREEKRLDKIDFVSERATRKIRVTHVEKPVELTGAAKSLDEAEKAYTARDLNRAKETYLRVLGETADKPTHAKAYYGLARIAVLQRDPETGDRLFRKVLELDPDAETKSWSLLYLGRLADTQGEREQAQEHYKAALAVEGAPDSVRQAAQKELNKAFTKKQ